MRHCTLLFYLGLFLPLSYLTYLNGLIEFLFTDLLGDEKVVFRNMLCMARVELRHVEDVDVLLLKKV